MIPQNVYDALSITYIDVEGNFCHINIILQVLVREIPDIVAFQEVRYEHSKGGTLGPNQMKHLSDILKDYQVVLCFLFT